MCLLAVDKKTKHTEGGTGYKVFIKRDGHLAGIYHGSDGRYMLRKEYNSEDYTHMSYEDYPLGFHIFIKKDDAKVWCEIHAGDGVWGVRFSDVVASGEDSCMGLPTVVARRMTVLRKVISR